MAEPVKPKRYPLSYKYSTTALGVVDTQLLTSELAASALSVQPLGVQGRPLPSLVVTFPSPVSPADKVIVDTVVAAHQAGTTAVLLAKEAKLLAINRKTANLIGAGSFEYPANSGKLFGMSEISQLNITGAFNSRLAVGFTYPVVFYTKNDLDSVSLADASAIEEFHAAAVAAIRTIREGGAALKAQVIAAATVEDVNAIQDNR
jgi:hypothetical protein